MQKRVLDPPPSTGTPAQLSLGSGLYGRYCWGCHGLSGGPPFVNNPDLRYSAALNSADAIKSVVIDGALKHNGMVSFASALGPQDAEAIRQYVIKRANDDRARGAN